jgi:uncharacterized protein YjaZ
MVKRYLIVTGVLLLTKFSALSQYSYMSDPDSAVFYTRDINNFWKAFDMFIKDTNVNPFQNNYIETGSAGVKGFVPNRIKSAENLFAIVKEKKFDYEKVRASTLRIGEKEKQCRSVFYALKYWYPDARYPPIYFVVGAFNSGGTISEEGVIIGAETQTDINNIPYIVAHEIIHYQQKTWSENPTLLQQSIVEGSADFLGELISGVNTNQAVNQYGALHKEKLCREFIARMNETDYTDWLYGVSKKDDRPNDLGYWMGYMITRQYFENTRDKKQAVKDILGITDYSAFLIKSGYLSKYIK